MQLVVSAAGAASHHHHSSSSLQCSVRCFNLKEHEMERRRRRELEKAGIDPDDDTPWIAPEEEQRIAEEDERRKAEQEVLVAAMLEKRAAEDAEKKLKFKQFRAKQVAMSKDAEKKLKFKQFRAKQVAMSKQRKDSNAASKDHKVNSREVQEVEAEETGPDSSSSKQ
ncbi:Hypothetical protein, putative [Bodo saltans]|uniref:Uncharacterized protein n=1 Tax=Bodo saltans TaxID=75058 RepID=A0A0S4J3Z0_BODSA|nr:Hypothetical protein, putative [Bodo saltans]|eukprot:CUG72518.1 Hypothetical protein, putative [Bodo saltans]